MLRRCVFLSMDSLEGYVCDDHLAIAPFRAQGWAVDVVSWHNTEVSWSDYEAVIIRSPWDYMLHPDAFLAALETIEASHALLLNPLSMVRWNLDKTYLRDLEADGIPIVPTLWGTQLTAVAVEEAFSVFQTPEIILKPQISGGAYHTYRISETAWKNEAATFINTFPKRPFMLQPFLATVLTEGEYSLFYFGGQFSHAIQKRPKLADFRVQEEHGGLIEAHQPNEALLAAGERVMRTLKTPLLYARVDFIRLAQNQDQFLVMELELIEPSLYLRKDHASAIRFADAFTTYMKAEPHSTSSSSRSA